MSPYLENLQAAAGPAWIHGSGPVPSDLAFVAEAPSRDELRTGMPLTGPSGKVNWTFAARYGGVTRDMGYVTNWSKMPLNGTHKEEMDDEEAREWTAYLQEELDAVAPKTVVALGAYAVRALLGPGYSLRWSNGRAYTDARGRVVVPVVHPAAGLHEPDALRHTAAGYAGLRLLREGRATVRPGREEWHAGGTTHVIRSGDAWVWPAGPVEVGIDTEGTVEHPFCLTFSWDGKQAYLIYADDKEMLEAFAVWLEVAATTIYMHNAVHDAAVLREMGIDVWKFDVHDTMVDAFNLQDMPLGLKDIAQGELAEPMTEYQDVVGPWQEKAEAEWRIEAYKRAVSSLSYEQQFTAKGKPRMSKGAPVFKRVGPELQTRLALHVERGHQLHLDEEHWAGRELGRPKPGLDLLLVPPEIHVPYAGRDAYVTRTLGPLLKTRVQAAGLQAVSELDHAVLPMVDDMEQVGLHVDIERLWEVRGELSTKRAAVEEQIREVTGRADFNPGSADDVEAFCLENKVPLTKLTKSRKRYSTDGNVLTMLQDHHPLIPLILEHRELSKYESSYLAPLAAEVDLSTNTLYHDIRYARVVSGRFAGRVLTWPSKTELGMKLRSIFTAPEGWKLASWDLSQIEMRVAAALSKDPVLTEVFLKGLDPHTNLASKLFSTPYDKVNKKEQRTPSKTVNYGLIYGIGGVKVWETLRGMGITHINGEPVTTDLCWQMIYDTWDVYAGLKQYRYDVGQDMRRTGMSVEQMLGRRRFLPGAQLVGDEWPLNSLRWEAERQGLNFRVQGYTAEMLKRTMVTVWNDGYPNMKHYFRLWLQIHDELMGQVREEHWDEVNAFMQAAMTQDSWMLDPIKIETEGKSGAAWSDLK